MNGPISIEASGDKHGRHSGDPTRRHRYDGESNTALTTLREELLPQTVGQVEGVEYAVTSTTAASHDWREKMKTAAPLVFGFVLVFAFGLLLVSFRSLVIAAKAIVLNLLSVGAAYGILVTVFQNGWGEGLLTFERRSRRSSPHSPELRRGERRAARSPQRPLRSPGTGGAVGERRALGSRACARAQVRGRCGAPHTGRRPCGAPLLGWGCVHSRRSG
jgi:MMPL family protein